MKKSFRQTMAWILAIVMVVLMAPLSFAATVDNANGGIFAEFVGAEAPEITDYLYVADMGTYHFARIRFQSSVDENKIYATVVYPKAAGNHPAILVCHGGGQYAVSHEPRMHNLGAAGYVAIAPDLPGIANPQKAVEAVQNMNAAPSEGDWWNNGVYGSDHMVESTDPKDNSIYAGVATALEAFNLLKSGSFIKNKQNEIIETVTVDAESMGVCGLSWGGYAATMVAGIMQDDVKALFSEYGSGYFDVSSYWTDNGKLASLSAEARQSWLDNLDAGRRAQYITANSYFAAASNDTYFHPGAVMKTIDAIEGETNQVFSPNSDHAVLVPGGTVGTNGAGSPAGCRMQVNFFNSVLKTGVEPALPKVTYGTTSLRNDGFHVVANITAPAEYPVTEATLYYSDGSEKWTKREWISVPATISGNKATAVIPKEALSAPIDYYVVVSDERPVVTKTPAVAESTGVSASTIIYRAPSVDADAIAVDIINYNSDSVNVGAGDGVAYRQFFGNTTAKYTVNVENAGMYTVHMSVGTNTDVNYNLFVNGVYCGNGTIVGSGQTTYPKENKVLTVTLPLSAGENVLTYQGKAGAMNVYSMVLNPASDVKEKIPVDSLTIAESSGNISWRNNKGKELQEGEELAEFVIFGGKVTYSVTAPVEGYYSLESLVATGGSERAVTITANGISTITNVTTEGWGREQAIIGTDIPLKKGENLVTITAPTLYVFNDGLCFTYEKEWAPAIDVDVMSESTVKYGNTRTDASNQVLFTGGAMEWTVDIAYDGLYTLDGSLSGAAASTASFAIWFDGQQVVKESDITFGDTSWKKEQHVVAENIPLKAGTHTFRLSNRAAAAMVFDLAFTKTAEYAADDFAAFTTESYESMTGSVGNIVNKGQDNASRVQIWYSTGYTWKADLTEGTYRVTVIGVTSEQYAGKAKLSLDGVSVADNCVISNNGYATDADAVAKTSVMVDNVITENLQITKSGEHLFTLDSVEPSKFFYFRRMIVEKIGDLSKETLVATNANGEIVDAAMPGNITVTANFGEEHNGVLATLYIATYRGAKLVTVVKEERTTEASINTYIPVANGESVKAFLWNSETLAPICENMQLPAVNTDPFVGDEEVNVVFLGGSITFGSGASNPANSYASKTGAWLKETYGERVNCYNAGVPGTPSDYGLLRLERDVISHNPDLVFVEFAVNDGNRDTRANIESIVKMLQECPTNPYIVFLYTTNSSYTTPVHYFAEVAEYYEIPQISLKDAIFRELSGKNPKDEGYFVDTVHPADAGHQVYFEEIRDCLASGKYYKKPADKPYTMIPGSGAVETTFTALSDSSVTATGSWTSGTVSPSWSFNKDIAYVKSTALGDKLSFTFTGTMLGIEHAYNKNAFKYEVWVDGEKKMTVDPYYETTSNQLICDSNTITFALREGTHNVEIITVENSQGGNSELTLYSVVTGRYAN